MTILVDENYARADQREARRLEELLTARFVAVLGERDGRAKADEMFQRRDENIRSDGRQPFLAEDL
jgi:hypothetical protein